MKKIAIAMSAGCTLLLAGCATPSNSTGAASFFVTSSNPGKGADLGGLGGADAHCQALAASAGLGAKTWRAYLSTQSSGGTTAVNARERVGQGPWQNVKGVVIAKDVSELHGTNNLTKQSALTEKGAVVNGRGDTPNLHDILTGTRADGTAFPPGEDRTCGNWTKGGDGSAFVGHADRSGLDTSPPALSWNASHATQGCSLAQLATTGGGGLLYCFASN